MNFSDTITDMIERGSGMISIGKPPPSELPAGMRVPFFARTAYIIPTGDVGNRIETVIQVTGTSVSDALNKLAEKFLEVDKMKVEEPEKIVSLGNGGRKAR